MLPEAAVVALKVNASRPAKLPLPNRGPIPNLAPLMSEKSNVNWAEIEAKPAFQSLLGRKAKFIITATIFFLAYYLALPVLVGYWPDLMKKPVWGKVNIAYLFALSQFLMTWALCALYVRAARRWDVMNDELLARLVRR